METPPHKATTRLQVEIDVPQGWRRGYVNRDFLPVHVFQRGVQILATHVVPDNYVCEITRVEAGVFAVINPHVQHPQVAQIDELHWWALNSNAHPPVIMLPPLPEIDWHLHLIQSPQIADNPPPDGTLFGPPSGFNPRIIGEVDQLWPIFRFGTISFDAHVIVVGPRVVGIFADWVQPGPQPDPQALPYQLAQSWGILEGRDLRYDSDEARRLLIGGLT